MFTHYSGAPDFMQLSGPLSNLQRNATYGSLALYNVPESIAKSTKTWLTICRSYHAELYTHKKNAITILLRSGLL